MLRINREDYHSGTVLLLIGALFAVLTAAGFAGAAPTANAATLEPERSHDSFPNDGTRILYLGDSITGNPGCWRSYVWQDLTNRGLNINPVGPLHRNDCGDVRNDAGHEWDPDHLGISGITTSRMFVKVAEDAIVERTSPDIVAVMLSTNDFMGGATAADTLHQFDMLLMVLRKADPKLSVVFAAVPPLAESRCVGCQSEIDALNAQLPAWAEQNSTEESPVRIADVASLVDVNNDLHDGIHPNAQGEIHIGQAFAPVLAEAVEEHQAALRESSDAASSWIMALTLSLLVIVAAALWLRGRQPKSLPSVDTSEDSSTQD